MAYFLDLTPHTYTVGKFAQGPQENAVNIGWLSAEEPFARGDVDWAIRERLLDLVAKPINLYRGSHVCDLCYAAGVGMLAPHQFGKRGNGEIRVTHNGVTYVAPVLITHYIESHGYRPPDVFLEAVRAQS